MNIRNILLVLVTALLFVEGCSREPESTQMVFTTRHGMGLDKWASIWLIKRQIAPQATIQWATEEENLPENTIAFDIPDAQYRRTGQASTFSALARGFDVDAEQLPDLEQLVHDIEINYWGHAKLRYSDWVERQFRMLQAMFGQERTPMACYLNFFDNIAKHLKQMDAPDASSNSQPQLVPDPSCATTTPDSISAHPTRQKLVPEWPVVNVLQQIQRGKKVVFVDVRETAEFEESRIPGALNLKIREINQADLRLLRDADLVIPYCVKDFRGFEMARLLQRKGLREVILMRPYGLKGWLAAGLPTAGTMNKQSEQQAAAQLNACVVDLSTCIKS